MQIIKKTPYGVFLYGVLDGTKFELFARKIIQEISNADNVLIFEKLKIFLTA